MADNNRKRKHQRWNPKTKQKSVEPGVVGLFFTCEGHEKQAVQEAYSIIEELLEKSENSTEEVKEDENVDSDEDIADALKKACHETKDGEKNKKESRRFIQRPTGVKNCIFVSVKNANISKLAEEMVDLAQKSARCRFLQRVIPVEQTLAVDLSKLNDAVMKVVSENLKPKENGNYPSYSVEFKARNNDSITKSNVLEMINDAITVFAPTARANLNHAEVTFFIQVSRTTAMVGVCRDFYTRRKYSMRPTAATV
ncbi:unnamed protein product [Caenorhabditis angaria]|uniref:THUMP domain-containing protein n=1 Tax=Caenorhabditis angaria TaxID=860376 RepID=A0A9P1IWH6_9PELO|nr:unnamed protein product [Caenorhabditis angaria]